MFLHSINILELENDLFLLNIAFRIFSDGIRTAFCLEFIISHYWGKTLLMTLSMPHELRGFPPRLGGQALVLALCERWAPFPLILSVVFTQLWVVSSYARAGQHFAEHPRGTLHRRTSSCGLSPPWSPQTRHSTSTPVRKSARLCRHLPPRAQAVAWSHSQGRKLGLWYFSFSKKKKIATNEAPASGPCGAQQSTMVS